MPVDRPLDDAQRALLLDEAVTAVALEPGDLGVFDSGCLHFAANGLHWPVTGGMNAALYHSMLTRPLLAQLRAAARREAGGGDASGDEGDEDDAWAAGESLRPSDLLRELDAGGAG